MEMFCLTLFFFTLPCFFNPSFIDLFHVAQDQIFVPSNSADTLIFSNH